MLLLVAAAYAAGPALPVTVTDTCAAVVPSASVGVLLAEAEAALSDLDEDGFFAAFGAAEGSLPCVGGPLTPEEAATWHRVAGVHAFLHGDPTEAGAHFRAYVSAHPGATLPADYAGEGGALLNAFRAAVTTRPGADRAVAVPRGLTARVDGAPEAVVPRGVAAVVQVTDAAGAVRATALVSGLVEPIDLRSVPGGMAEPAPEPPPVAAAPSVSRAPTEPVGPDVPGVERGAAVDAQAAARSPTVSVEPERPSVTLPIPGVETAAPVAAGTVAPPPALPAEGPPERAPAVREDRRRHPVGLVAGAAGSAALAGGSYALSWFLRSRFDDVDSTPVDVGELPGLRAGTNATAAAAPVLGGLALGLGVIAVVTW